MGTLKLTPLTGVAVTSTKTELEDLLANLPMRRFNQVIHVGDPGMGTGTSSHEGPLLSASQHPEAWRQIARVGGNEWSIRRKSGNLTFVHMLAKGTKDKLAQWGIHQGLVVQETWWWTPTSTDEEENPLFCWCRSKEEAENEHDPDTGVVPVEKEVVVPGPALWAFWNQRTKSHGNPSPWHSHCALAANLVVTAHQTFGAKHPLCPDGLFWNERFEPENLSAPRMGINPHPELRIQPA